MYGETLARQAGRSVQACRGLLPRVLASRLEQTDLLLDGRSQRFEVRFRLGVAGFDLLQFRPGQSQGFLGVGSDEVAPTSRASTASVADLR